MGNYGKFSVHINAQISCDEMPYADDDDDDYDDADDDDDDLDGGLMAGGYRRSKGSRSSSSATSSSKGSRSSVSSSHTVQENVVTEAGVEVGGEAGKEDTPTPVNSDSEAAEGDAFHAGTAALSPLSNGVDIPTSAMATSHGSVARNREVSYVRTSRLNYGERKKTTPSVLSFSFFSSFCVPP